MSLLRDRMSRDMERAGLSPATQRNYILAIRNLTGFFQRPPDQLPRVLSPEEVAQILAAVRQTRWRTLFALRYDTGLRIGEAIQLKVGDIDRARGVIHVRCGKGGKPRQVKLGDRLYDLLRAYWRELRQQEPQAGSFSQESLLFVGLQGRGMNPNVARRVLHLAVQRAGITKPVTLPQPELPEVPGPGSTALDQRPLPRSVTHPPLPPGVPHAGPASAPGLALPRGDL